MLGFSVSILILRQFYTRMDWVWPATSLFRLSPLLRKPFFSPSKPLSYFDSTFLIVDLLNLIRIVFILFQGSYLLKHGLLISGNITKGKKQKQKQKLILPSQCPSTACKFSVRCRNVWVLFSYSMKDEEPESGDLVQVTTPAGISGVQWLCLIQRTVWGVLSPNACVLYLFCSLAVIFSEAWKQMIQMSHWGLSTLVLHTLDSWECLCWRLPAEERSIFDDG